MATITPGQQADPFGIYVAPGKTAEEAIAGGIFNTPADAEKAGYKFYYQPTTPTNPTTPEIRYPTNTTDSYGELLKSRTTGQKTDAEIQAEERARIQAQIDALENYWSQTILPELQQEAKGRAGETKAISSGGGLLGTPMGSAQKEKTASYSRQLNRAERAKIDAQISSLYAKADERAIDRAEKQATLLRQDQDAYQQYLKDQQSEARNDLITMFSGGVTLDDLKSKDQERYKQLLENAGIKDEFMAQAIYNANAPTEAKKDIKYQTVGNKVIGYYYDDATGGIKTIESEEIAGLGGGNYKTQVAGGTMLLIPENIDPNKPLDQQILQYGKTGQFRAASGGGGSDEKNFEKIISNFNDDVSKAIMDDVDEDTAFRALKAKYSEYFSDEEIKEKLGMDTNEPTIRVI